MDKEQHDERQRKRGKAQEAIRWREQNDKQTDSHYLFKDIKAGEKTRGKITGGK